MGHHAYMILAHNNFGQLKKLIELLDDPRNDIFIHIDGKAKFNDKEWDEVCRYSKLTFLKKRFKVHWGGVSIMRSELALIKAATTAGKYEYYHLLSGMDLPIKDQDTIHDFFTKNEGKEFIDMWELSVDMKDRLIWFTPFPERERNFILHAINKTCRNFQKFLGKGINKDIEFRFGSTWFSITDEFARHILSKEEWLMKIFKHTIISDEFFIPTLLWNSTFKENIYDTSFDKKTFGNMRLIDWSRGESIRHPWTFRISDWDMLMSSPCLWARKFDERIDNEIIENIYRKLKKNEE